MKTSQINPGAPRGKEAAIIGFQKTGILMPDPSILGRTPTPLPMAVFDGLKKDIRYRQGSELHYLLGKAIEKDAKVIDMSGPRLFWSGSAEDTAALTTVAMEGMRALMQSKPPDYAIDVQRTAPGARNYGVYHACWM
jgi:hypothetical protein